MTANSAGADTIPMVSAAGSGTRFSPERKIVAVVFQAPTSDQAPRVVEQPVKEAPGELLDEIISLKSLERRYHFESEND